ncbi:hypothetical protein B484DRAFT_402656 [Ochromonadaceae sp. CCMP2298]|nr:hypothetical protein B484DRAFT_402656 [Ochromonadaceae sp. CCMP2298]
MSLSVSLPQAEPEGSPMRTVLPHSQSGTADPYSRVLQEALDSLHPIRDDVSSPLKRAYSCAPRALSSNAFTTRISIPMGL